MSLLDAPNPGWAVLAQTEIGRWRDAAEGLVDIHHIGSTSVPGLPAKPVIDLLPVFDDEDALNEVRANVVALGYEWLGEHGIVGRRYTRRILSEAPARMVHAHCFAAGHPAITRHLRFRDLLRSNAVMRAAYVSVKAAAAARHPAGGTGYQAEKGRWIEKVLARIGDNA